VKVINRQQLKESKTYKKRTYPKKRFSKSFGQKGINKMQTAEELLQEYRQPQQAPQYQANRNIPEPDNGEGQAEQMLQEYREMYGEPEKAPEAPEVQPETEEPGYIQRGLSAIGEAITGTERQKAAGVEDMPEFAFAAGSTGQEDLDLTTAYGQRTAAADLVNDTKLAAGLMLETSDEGKKKLIKRYMPEVKIKDRDGVTIITLPDGTETVLNKPGFTAEDFKGVLGQLAWFFGPSKIAALGKLKKAGTATKAGAAALAEGFAEYGRQKTTQALGSGQETDVIDVGVSGLTGGLTTAAGPLIKQFREGRQAKKLGIVRTEAEGLEDTLKEGIEAAQETGIGLWPGQLTEAPSAQAKQIALQRLEGGTQKALQAIKKQDAEVAKAVEDVLEIIAPARAIETAPAKVVSAAKKLQRAKETSRPVRVLSKLDPEDQAKLDMVAGDIFKPRITDTYVKQIKKVIKKQSPEAWAAITRRRFEDLLTQEGSDTPGKVMNALFSNPANKKQLYAALDTEQAKRLKFLEVAVKRAKQGRILNPAKEAEEIAKITNIDKGIWSTIGGMFTPFETAKDKFKGIGAAGRRAIMADAVFNPKWNPDWAVLRKLNPQSPAAKNKMQSILIKASKDFTKPTAQALRAKATGD
jgi:hypothetical protein